MLPTGVFDTTALQDYNKYRIYQAMSKACKSEVLKETKFPTKRKKTLSKVLTTLRMLVQPLASV